jgi:signal transduction histidine kinase
MFERLGKTARLALLAIVLLHYSGGAALAGTRHVLMLSSSERPFAPQGGFAEALIRDLVRSSREPIQFVDLSVQAARDSDRAPDLATAQRIRSAVETSTVDLVITVGGPAAAFAQQLRPELFPTTPMLIAGVDRRFVDNATFSRNETAVATQHDPALMIDEILRLLPDTRTVMVVVGTSRLEQFWLQDMKREFRRFADRLQLTWTNDMSFDEIVERCRTMPAHSAIFFATLALDGKGEPRVQGDTLTALHSVASAPMFALYGLGHGIVGGPLLSTDELSRTTTQVALRLLAGESPDRIQTPTQRSGQPTYDARELRHWSIAESRLPPASVVLFRGPTTRQGYQRAFTYGALVGALPALLLLVTRMKRGRTGRVGQTAAHVPVPGFADATVTLWTAGADGQRLEIGGARTVAHHQWTSGVHPDDLERCRESYRVALERREPFQIEYRVRDAGGAERWIFDTGVPRFDGKKFDRYVGAAVDISRLARAHAELSHLSRHLLQAYEREQAELALTLREDVCQRMVALTLRLHARARTAPDGEFADIARELTSLVGEIVAVSDSVPQRLELLGLACSAQALCEELSTRHHVAIHFDADGVPDDLPLDVALALFRVIQEGAANAVSHSGSQDVWVSVRGTETELRLCIVDRGVGFDTQRVPSGAVGLVALRERLKLVNGDIAISSCPSEGTRIQAWVPLPTPLSD